MTHCRVSESTLSTYHVVTQYRVRFVCIAKDLSQSSHPPWTNVSSRIFLSIPLWQKLRIVPVRSLVAQTPPPCKVKLAFLLFSYML